MALTVGAAKAAAFAKAKALKKSQSAQSAQAAPVSSFLESLAGSILGVANDALAPDAIFGPGATLSGVAPVVLTTVGSAVGGLPASLAEQFAGSCLEAGGVCANPVKAAVSGPFVPILPAVKPAAAPPSDFNLVKSEVDASGFLLAAVVIAGLYFYARKAG